VKCATCKQFKTRNRFYLSPKHPGGISSSCRTCYKMVSQTARDAAEAADPRRPAPAGPQVVLSMMHPWLEVNHSAHLRVMHASGNDTRHTFGLRTFFAQGHVCVNPHGCCAGSIEASGFSPSKCGLEACSSPAAISSRSLCACEQAQSVSRRSGG